MLLTDLQKTLRKALQMSRQLAGDLSLFRDEHVAPTTDYLPNKALSLGHEQWLHFLSCRQLQLESKEPERADASKASEDRTRTRSDSSTASIFSRDKEDEERPETIGSAEDSLHSLGSSSHASPSITIAVREHTDADDRTYVQWMLVKDMKMRWSWPVRKVSSIAVVTIVIIINGS